VFERAYRVCKVALERMAVLPGKRIGSVRSDVLGHAVEPISDEVAAGIRPLARQIRREYLVGTTPQQQLERLREQVLQGLADERVGVGDYPATEAEVAAGIFFRSTGGLNNAIETDLFGDDELAHSLLQSRPCESSRTADDCQSLRPISYSLMDRRTRLCEIDRAMPGCRLTMEVTRRERSERSGGTICYPGSGSTDWPLGPL